MTLASYTARRYPGLRGVTRPNLSRMRQFYDTYRAALLDSLPGLRPAPAAIQP